MKYPLSLCAILLNKSFKDGLPYDEKMQSKRSHIHQSQSPSSLSFPKTAYININVRCNHFVENINNCIWKGNEICLIIED